MSVVSKSDVNKVFNSFLENQSNKEEVLSITISVYTDSRDVEMINVLSKKLDEHSINQNCEKEIKNFQYSLLMLL